MGRSARMKIGLVSVDDHNFPNLSLMKISSYHKARGDDVQWANSLERFDKVYMAKVFDFSHDDLQAYQTDELVQGGTGYNLTSKLPAEIESQFPDYSLYSITDTAYGFLSRGCPRGCKFCIVGKKEGLVSRKVADLKDFWNGQKNIECLDPNLLACEDWKDLLQQLADSKAIVNINQGMDIRLMTDEKQVMLNKINLKMIHFAWDNYEFNTYQKLKTFRQGFKLDGRHLRVYVLTNFNTTHEENLERIYKLKELDYDPYVMVFDKQHAPKQVKRLQRWVNNKFIFRSCERFEDYKS